MSETTRRPGCSAEVYHGRSPSPFPCGNYALPGDTLCGTHRAAVNRRNAKDEPVEATAPPSVKVTETIRVRLEWPDGNGPVFQPPYDSRRVRWSWLSTSIVDGKREEFVDGYGFPVLKDGTAGGRSVDPRFMKLANLPEDVREALDAAVAEVL